MDSTIVRRMLVIEAMCKLHCLLESFSGLEKDEYEAMKKKITEFEKWLWDESPIA